MKVYHHCDGITLLGVHAPEGTTYRVRHDGEYVGGGRLDYTGQHLFVMPNKAEAVWFHPEGGVTLWQGVEEEQPVFAQLTVTEEVTYEPKKNAAAEGDEPATGGQAAGSDRSVQRPHEKDLHADADVTGHPV